MADNYSFPSTFAGKLGVADVTNAIKRRYFSLLRLSLLNDTETNLIPEAPISERAGILEEVRISFNVTSTFSNQVVFTLYDETGGAALATLTKATGYASTGVQHETMTVDSGVAEILAERKLRVYATYTAADYNKMEEFVTTIQFREATD